MVSSSKSREAIPLMDGSLIKYLGKWYDASISNMSKVSLMEIKLDEWLRRTERSGLSGEFKAWLFQHGLLPRLMLLLTIYNAPMTSVEGIGKRASKQLCKWLGIPPSILSVGLYILSVQLQLHLSFVVGEYKAWTKWDLLQFKIPWSEIWRLEPF